jgi:uncharacterized membrane protein YeaQ/YmgE (transglycosylase-associated protein family)
MTLTNEGLVVILVVGLVAGWLAGLIMGGSGFGLVGDLTVGIIGAVVGDWFLPHMGIDSGVGMVASIIDAMLGAVGLLVIIRVLTSSRTWFGGWGRSALSRRDYLRMRLRTTRSKSSRPTKS